MPVLLLKGTFSLESCKEKAKVEGYTVIGIQFGFQCWSGPNAESTYDTYGPSAVCNNGSGGRWANDVYRITGEQE